MMTRLRLWLFALTLAIIGCGGHTTDDESGDADGSAIDATRDRDALGASDSAVFPDGDARGMNVADTRDGNVVDEGSDARPDVLIDTRDAGSPDARDGDALRDVVDASEDAVADIHADSHDVSVDSDAPPDVSEDAGTDVPPADAPSPDGCTAITCGLVALYITPTNPTMIARTTRWMGAGGEYLDGSTRNLTNDVVWSTSQPEGAHISNGAGRRGLLTAINIASPTITAALGPLSASTVVNVSSNEPRLIQVRPSLPSMAQGTERKLTAMVTFSDGSQMDWSSSVTWSSSASTVATVNADGIATGLTPGTTTVTADIVWLTGSTTLTVTPATLSSLSITPATTSLPLGLVQPLRAVGRFSDGTTQDLTAQAAWSSSDASRVAVGDALGTKGKITGVTLGSATVTATFGGISATAAIDVSAAVLQNLSILYPPNGRLMLNMDLLLVTRGSYSDLSTREITDLVSWTSGDPAVIAVDGPRIYARGEGATQIVGTYAGVQGSLFLEVWAGALESIDITPSPAAVARGASVSLRATGNYLGGTTYDLTWFGGWHTLDDYVAWVENTPASPASLWGANVGATTVSIGWAGVSASSVVNVTTIADASPGD